MASTEDPVAQTNAQGSKPSDVVLIVDDEAPIAEALALIIEDAGYRAVAAFRGQEALALARELRPAMLITDLMMPQLDGAALVYELRKEAQSDLSPLPIIIAMTAGGVVHAHAVEPDGVLQKPFSIEDVESLLRRFLPHDRDNHSAREPRPRR